MAFASILRKVCGTLPESTDMQRDLKIRRHKYAEPSIRQVFEPTLEKIADFSSLKI